MNTALKIIVLAGCVLALTTPSYAWFLDFEWGLGHDGQNIASGVPGLQFTTTDNQNWVYGDITTGLYNTHSDNNSMYGTADYFMGGNVFAWLGPNQGQGRIDFLNDDGSTFTTGYCSASTFYLEAYDKNGNLITSTSGGPNRFSDGGTGLDYLTVTSGQHDIAYVLLHDTGNFWLTDNMSGDASGVNPPSVPEPVSLVLLGTGLLGVAIFRRREN
jgi:hypothetical protein